MRIKFQTAYDPALIQSAIDLLQEVHFRARDMVLGKVGGIRISGELPDGAPYTLEVDGRSVYIDGVLVGAMVPPKEEPEA